jgi:hypothetical protein
VTSRPTKFFAALLAALLCASGGLASFAACPHATRDEGAQAAAAHDCCHALRAAARRVIRGGHEGAHHSHETGCTPHGDGDSARVEPQSDSDAPCADCCAPRLAGTNTPALASARGEGRGDGDAHDATAPQPPTFTPPRRREVAPKQHAPPAPRARPRALDSVLLI